MNKNDAKIRGIFFRYFFLILIALPNLFIFYFIFGPLTVYPVLYTLKLFFNAMLVSTRTIFLGHGIFIDLIDACIAGSAYYLLLILNLLTPDIKVKKRIYMIFSSFLVFLVANILRIVFLTYLAASGSELFAITHKLFWYFISVVFVVCIWFFQVRFFKIKTIPLYSDFKFLFRKTRK